MMQTLKRVTKKSRTAIIAHKIYENWRMKRQFQTGNFESLHGSTHSTILTHLSESIDYINVQFDDYLTYSGLTLDQLQGVKIFELGFGDNVGVALKFIAAGAKQVVCLDKFYSKRNLDHQRQIYLALRETLDEKGQAKFDEAIDLTSGVEINSDRIVCIYGKDVEDAAELKNLGPFDLVISRGAIQDIFNPDAAFEAMDRILAPRGWMLHKIDLSDQGMFRANGMNPLTFLTVSEPVYRLMAIDSGKPNRKLIGYYRDVMKRLGYDDAQLLVTGIIGVGECGKGDLHPHKPRVEVNVDYPESILQLVRDVRPRLAEPFKDLPDSELIIDGIFIVAQKHA